MFRVSIAKSDHVSARLPGQLASKNLGHCMDALSMDERPELPAPKSRPALVTAVYQIDRREVWLRVMYGTSRNWIVRQKQGGKFTSRKREDLFTAGLVDPTAFVLRRQIELPWTADFFGTWTRKDGTTLGPVLGRVPRKKLPALKRALAPLAS